MSPEEVATLLEASRAALEAECRALGDAGSAFHPAADEWCVKEVVGHFIEGERRGFAGRIRHLVSENRPTLESWDPPAVAAARRDCERPVADLLAEFGRLREESLALIRSLTPADLDRVGTHPVVGDLSTRDLLQEWVFHDRNHLKQALSNSQARVWPHMGNGRRFSQPDA